MRAKASGKGWRSIERNRDEPDVQEPVPTCIALAKCGRRGENKHLLILYLACRVHYSNSMVIWSRIIKGGLGLKGVKKGLTKICEGNTGHRYKSVWGCSRTIGQLTPQSLIGAFIL